MSNLVENQIVNLRINSDSLKGSLLEANNNMPRVQDLGYSFLPNIWTFILIILLTLVLVMITIKRIKK